MSEADDENGLTESRLFLRQNEPQLEQLLTASLEIVVYSQRCPGKETDNEDGAALIPVSSGAAVLAIADGVGGARGGELAAAAALEALASAVNHEQTNPELLRIAILNGIEQANAAVCGLNLGAATTLAVVEFWEHTVRPYHVGDSKILITGQRGRLHYQTMPHSPIGYAVEAGMMGEKQAMFHENSHLVSNVVGDPHMRMEVGPALTLAPKDTVLIASDGLFDNLWVEEIVSTIRSGPLAEAVAELAALADRRMNTESEKPSKPDDLTMIAFRRLSTGENDSEETDTWVLGDSP